MSMQAAVSMPLAKRILRRTYSEGSVFGFLLRKLRRTLVYPFDSEMSLTLSVTQASSTYDYSTVDVFVYATEVRRLALGDNSR
jgi:hypothetical protein